MGQGGGLKKKFSAGYTLQRLTVKNLHPAGGSRGRDSKPTPCM